nr:unnamed protein product [Callosobruchus analis]
MSGKTKNQFKSKAVMKGDQKEQVFENLYLQEKKDIKILSKGIIAFITLVMYDVKEWLVENSYTGGSLAKCKFCQCRLNNKYSDLKSHAESKKHKTNSK